jgi:hypothetical protein
MQQADLGAGGVLVKDNKNNNKKKIMNQQQLVDGSGSATAIAAASPPLPKCFCNWKHCRTYQKAFREFKHPLFNGVIKLKFVKNDRKSLALKATVDRTLHVDATKRNEWREAAAASASADNNNNNNNDNYELQCRYYVARHHFTEALIKQYLGDRRAWDWNEPLSMSKASKFLWSLDRQDVYHSEDEVEEDIDDDDDENEEDAPTRYVQAPNVPKDQVREMLKKLKEESRRQREAPPEPVVVVPEPEVEEPVPDNHNDEDDDDDHHNHHNHHQASLKAFKNPSKPNSSVHTQSTLSTSITDTLKAFEDDVVGIDSTNNNSKNDVVSDIVLAQKDEENKRLREELNECQKQLSMLHNMVNKLQVDIGSGGDAAAAAAAAVATTATAAAGKPVQSKAGKKKNKKKKKKEDVSSEEEDYEVVDDSNSEEEEEEDADEEDELEEDDEEEEEEEEEEEGYEDWSNGRERPHESEDEETISTYHVNGTINGSVSGRAGGSRHSSSVRKGSIHSKRSLRRDSVHSRHSMHSRSRHSMRRDSIHSRRSMRGGVDDGASVMSRQSLQSVSPSIKSLPREIQLMDDEDDSKGKDDFSFFDDSYRKHDDDARSVGSRSAASRMSRKSIVSGGRSRGRNSRRPAGLPATTAKSKPGPSGRGGSAVPREIDLSGDEVEPDVTNVNVSTDTFFVTDRQIVDPYGEKGVYSGALSKSTGMPNGKGRLEYEKEGRWYEGDWIHGRWTGYGRLSNGDGDFYEGGLKNDHKHGPGVMRFADGRVFEGEYIRGQMIQGKMTYQDGSVYGGSWVDGMRHGRGKCIFVDGSEYEGDFREGNFHGHGKMTWNDGGWYIGEWCDGEMHGKGKEIRPDGSLRHDGEWSRGQPIRSASDARRRRQQQQTSVEAS